MIVYGHTPRTKRINAPSLVQRTSGTTLKERALKLKRQLKQVDEMLSGCTDAQTRAHLNSARSSLLGSIAYCEAYELRTRPSYA